MDLGLIIPNFLLNTVFEKNTFFYLGFVCFCIQTFVNIIFMLLWCFNVVKLDNDNEVSSMCSDFSFSSNSSCVNKRSPIEINTLTIGDFLCDNRSSTSTTDLSGNTSQEINDSDDTNSLSSLSLSDEEL